MPGCVFWLHQLRVNDRQGSKTCTGKQLSHRAAQRAGSKKQDSHGSPLMKLRKGAVPCQGPVRVNTADLKGLYGEIASAQPERGADLIPEHGTVLNEQDGQLGRCMRFW
ncbi:hypothetical protein D9M68_718030 [compost metagenome]